MSGMCPLLKDKHPGSVFETFSVAAFLYIKIGTRNITKKAKFSKKTFSSKTENNKG
ncbi:hypothetical protein T11_13039 [Trichinella zimbabwensis]|uniref:Uncharacterized protein n=1 Tax=Trichinella zimbabwensis TaxID=268475 RepID=A0A0V1GLN9_9BILA|nr:hypothetical protein T11_13039 [Trichinella zimbabwensis]